MPPPPDFRTRTLALLDSARDDDTLVVAHATPDGGLLMQTCTPTPHGLIAIARCLLSQASDKLDHDDIAAADEELLASVMEALSVLPEDNAETEEPR
jgi:hypothetical protein